jgi:hypothetical protein
MQRLTPLMGSGYFVLDVMVINRYATAWRRSACGILIEAIPKRSAVPSFNGPCRKIRRRSVSDKNVLLRYWAWA